MSEEHDFERCLAIAQHVVSSYRAGAPEGCDPQNSFAAIGGFLAVHGTEIVAVSAIVGAGAAVTGGIMQYNAQQAQGRTAAAMAAYNAHQQELNAKMQLAAMQAQAAIQKRMAEANFRMRSAEAQARFNNAISIENTVEGQSRSVRESIRRKGMQFDADLATTRATIAKSGFVESSGSPKGIVEALVMAQRMEANDTLYADQLNRDSLFREAELERFGGKMALAGATLDRNSSLAGAGLMAATGQAEYRSRLREAEMTRLSGAASKRAYQGQAWGSLLSGIGEGAGALSGVNWSSLSSKPPGGKSAGSSVGATVTT
jgi:hypothetical protein